MARIDPYMSFRFKIEIDGITEGGFTEVSGLQARTEVEDFREGGVNHFTHKLPKETKFENLVLKKGLADSEELWKWHREVVSGKFKRKDVTIVMYKNTSDENAQRWRFQKAFPIKWTGPDFKAEGNTVAFETLELAHHGYAA